MNKLRFVRSGHSFEARNKRVHDWVPLYIIYSIKYIEAFGIIDLISSNEVLKDKICLLEYTLQNLAYLCDKIKYTNVENFHMINFLSYI